MTAVDHRAATTTLRDVVAAERIKATSSWLWLYCLAFGIFLAVLSVAGSASEADALLEAGVERSTVTAESIRYWFMVLLASSIFGLLFVTREYGNDSIARSVLLSGTRTRLFVAKMIVSTAVGVVFAVVTLGLIALSYLFIVPLSGEDAQWSSEATKTSIGVLVVIVVAAPWGAAIGWIVRHQGIAVAALLALTLVIDEGLFRLLPEVGRYTLQIAMGSIYLDDREDLLGVPVASVVVAAWLVAASVLAGVLLSRRDVP